MTVRDDSLSATPSQATRSQATRSQATRSQATRSQATRSQATRSLTTPSLTTPSPPARVLIVCVRLYQRVLSPLLGGHCRFLPTCSNYALEAMTDHGARRGGWLAIRRLLRCHPFGGRGYDPPP